MSNPVGYATLCLILNQEKGQILLSKKKIGVGQGFVNAYGGKVKTWLGERIIEATVREVEEEVGLSLHPQDLKKLAVIGFFFGNAFQREVHVFVSTTWQGKPISTNEMSEPVWYDILRLPWEKMWAGDQLWLPSVLSGEKVKADIFYCVEGKTVEKVIMKEVDF